MSQHASQSQSSTRLDRSSLRFDDLIFDSANGIDEYPHLSHLWGGVRKGGPKEKRLRKVISMIPDTRKENMYGLRVENVSLDVELEDLLKAFEHFGEIGAFYRPTDTSRHIPTKYVFVRYLHPGCAEMAMEALQGRKFGVDGGGSPICIKEAKQTSFFTFDTGYITNEALDTKEAVEKFFDSSLPETHYQVKHEEELKKADEVYTIRIDDLHESITPENLRDLFRQYGEISSIYYPFDLRNRKYRGFAFVRFIRQQDAVLAWRDMHNVNLGVGRNIQVTPSIPSSYFSMDESD